MQSARLSVLALAVGLALPAFAQQAPDAGRTLQELQPPAATPPQPGPALVVQPPAEEALLPGGQRVTLQAIAISGHTVFSEQELLDVIGDVRDQSFDLAGLKGLARRVTEHYHAAGYPFARALIPVQTFDDGVLSLRVVEGRYGRVSAQGDLADAASRFLDRLSPGEVISFPALERATLILADQPGISISPLVRPGQEIGTGDLVVEVSREPMFSGELGLDNHGNRYTGEYRLKATAHADSPFMLGDRIRIDALYTDEGLWLGGIDYSAPLGTSGLRGRIGYNHTYYELGEDFASLDAHGTANVASIGLSYPIVRSQGSNLYVSVDWQEKRLNDQQDLTGDDADRDSRVIPLVLQFDHRDDLWGGGVSFGALGYSLGDLELDSALEAADIATGMDTRGSFSKWNLDVARLQSTPLLPLTLYGRVSAQWAGDNLDSSESFILGGARGVRAYPQGEGVGDEGWLVQLEARYQIGAYGPYVFYDTGRTRVHAKPAQITPAVADNTRSVSGAGLGLRYTRDRFTLDAAVAWRTSGGEPESDSKDRNPRLWFTGGWRF
jgi:hemolysin activation/secretion protein